MRLLLSPRAGQLALHLTAAAGCYCSTFSPLPFPFIGKQRIRGKKVILDIVPQLTTCRTQD